MKNFWEEIKRRKVFQFAAIYAVVAWLVVQISVAVFPTLLLPDWATRFVVVIAVIGFPLVLILAWAHDSEPKAVEKAMPAKPVEVQPLPDCPSLAVLPFSNISSDPEQEHLADSLTEDLITDLSKHSKLDVVARNSTFVYKGQAVDVRQVGKDLDVHLVLEGSLRKAKDMVRFTAQLIDARTGHHLWADRQDLEIQDELATQDLMCRSIAQGILAQLFGEGDSAAPVLPKPEALSLPLSLNNAGPITQYTQVDGLNIAYNEQGKGPPDFVFVPGMVSHLELASNIPGPTTIPNKLQKLGHVVSFDKRGQGMSDPVKGTPDLEERMNDVRGVMDAAGLEKAFLFGTSEGAPMSILFAATYPERVHGLILFGGCARWSKAEDYSIGIPEDSIGASLSQWGTGQLRGTFNPELSESQLSIATMAAIERLIANPASIQAITKLIQKIDVRDILPMVQVPTLVMHMEKDFAVPRRLAKYMANFIPGAEYYEMPGMGHMTFPDNPEHLERIRTFCDSVADRAYETEAILATILAIRGDVANVVERAQKFSPGRISTINDDTVVLTFDGPSRAVRCANMLAHELSGGEMRFSLHSGLVDLKGGGIGGKAVQDTIANLSRAPVGKPLLTQTVFELVQQSSLKLAPFDTEGSEQSVYISVS